MDYFSGFLGSLGICQAGSGPEGPVLCLRSDIPERSWSGVSFAFWSFEGILDRFLHPRPWFSLAPRLVVGTAGMSRSRFLDDLVAFLCRFS